MQRIQCSYSELQAQPAEVVEIIRQFIIGEDIARQAMKPADPKPPAGR